MIQNLTHSDYLAHKAFGSSDIIKMLRSFAYYKWAKSRPPEKTRALVVGSVVHLLLEAEITSTPSLLSSIYIYKQGSSLTAGFKSFQKENPQLYCLDEKEEKLCRKAVKALLDEPEVMSYLVGAIAEPTIIAKYPGTDILCKCRPDYLHKSRGVSINIKTTTDASESGFIYAAKDYSYDFQSAFYCDILTDQLGKPFDEVHILVEKTDDDEPCPVKIFSFGDETLSWARFQIRSILDKIPEAEKTGIWPKPKAFLETIDLPLYARKVANL